LSEEKLVEVLSEFVAAMQNATEVLRQGLARLEKAPAQSGLSEESFNILKWESQKGERLGDFEVAYKAHNIPDNWQHAYNILKANNATIKNHFGPEGYAHYYWLYLEKYDDRIFRKKRS